MFAGGGGATLPRRRGEVVLNSGKMPREFENSEDFRSGAFSLGTCRGEIKTHSEASERN